MPEGTEAATAEPTTETQPETTPPEATPESLGDAGKLALQRERDARKRAEADAKANADAAKRLAEIEESQKTETQKLTDRATKAESQAATAEMTALKLEVALDKAPEGASVDVIRQAAKRLTGTTREELEADADELYPVLVPSSATETTETTTQPPQRPKEKLRSGTPTPVEVGDDDGIARALKQKLGIR